MKIKALKTFICGRVEAVRDEIVDVPDSVGQRMIARGSAEAVEEEEPEEQNGEPKAQKNKAGKNKGDA